MSVIKSLLSGFAAIGLIAGAAQADTLVNINYEKFTPGGPGTFATESELEGVLGGLGTEWNQYADEDTSGIVVDSTGANTTITVDTNFSEGRFGNTTTNLDVFHSSLTDFGRKQNRTVTINGLTPNGLYNIAIMAYRDSTAARERLGGYWSANNPTTSPTGERLLSSYVTRNGTTFEDGVNYLLFENVEADGSGIITFTGRGGALTDPDFNDDVRLGLSALQIQTVIPTPSSFAIASLGFAMIGMRRRRG